MIKKDKLKLQIRHWFTVGVYCFFIALVVGSLGYINNNQKQKKCSAIHVKIDNEFDNYFVDEKIVMNYVTDFGKDSILGKLKDKLNVFLLENRLLQNPFIAKVNVFNDLDGNIDIDIIQKRPIARLLTNRGISYYLDENGEVLPLSNRFTSRVMLLTGDRINRLVTRNNDKKLAVVSDINSSTENTVSLLGKVENTSTDNRFPEAILEMLMYIDHDPFWRQMIAQINIDRNNEMTLMPQVGQQAILFGTSENYEEKFQKLMIFYQKAMPTAGWMTYKSINLKFKDQIICKK